MSGPHARYHLGVALGDAGAYEEAVVWLRQVLAAEPEHAAAAKSLGYCYSRLGQPTQPVAAFERAAALQPNDAQAHVNLGLTLLQLGDYPRGFAEYEWRGQAGPVPPVQGPHPRWDGRPVPTQTLLIYTEPGMSEAIQYARYLPLAAQRCGTLIVVCPADLRCLFATLPGVAQLREAGTVTAAEFDTYLPLPSLPRVFGTTRTTIPAAVPYVDVAALRRRQQAALTREALRQQQVEALIDYGAPVRAALQSFEAAEKRIAFEALDIRVTWTPGQPPRIQDTIPIDTIAPIPPASHKGCSAAHGSHA
jgi:Anaphase-promoting complex, cyclosome, subunit 3